MPRQLHKTITAQPITVTAYLAQVWQARHLIFTFAKRDLKVQYAQTYLGVLWSLLQPLTGLVIFTFFFQKIIHLQIDVPYGVFAFSGIMGWFYFTSLVGQAGTSLMNQRDLIRKIHFPLLVLPLSKALVGLVEFGISLVLLLVLLSFSSIHISYKLIFLPFAVAANILAGLSIGLWLSALTIRFRDLHQIIPFLIGFGIWLTPVFYPTTVVPSSYSFIYYFHPVANVIALYRWIFMGMPVQLLEVLCSFGIALILCVSGLLFFIRNEIFVSDYL